MKLIDAFARKDGRLEEKYEHGELIVHHIVGLMWGVHLKGKKYPLTIYDDRYSNSLIEQLLLRDFPFKRPRTIPTPDRVKVIYTDGGEQKYPSVASCAHDHGVGIEFMRNAIYIKNKAFYKVHGIKEVMLY